MVDDAQRQALVARANFAQGLHGGQGSLVIAGNTADAIVNFADAVDRKGDVQPECVGIREDAFDGFPDHVGLEALVGMLMNLA